MNPNNENYEQNGGLPSLSARNALPVEYKNKDNVCRDYVWGKCTKVQCKFVHECDLQVMLNILHFCHDYQNCTGCKRPNCTFLHATREEEKLFREEGQFPADLVKRHSQMHAALASMSRKYEESYKNKPPPPPLENQQALPQMLMVNPMYQTAPRWFLQPPPPPPPPREPSPPPPHYSGPPPPAPGPSSAYHGQSVLPPPAAAPAPAYSQPIVPHQIDTSKPPPPFLMQHVHVKRLPEAHEGSPPKLAATPYASQPVPDTLSPDVSKPPPPLFPASLCASSILGKRVHPDSYDASEAGPIRRISSNSQSSSCENCTRWDLRALLIEKKLREHLAEKACAVLKYEEKKTEVGNIVELLGCLTAPQSDPSNSVSDISTPLDETLLRALVANHIKEKPNFVPKHSMNSVLRRITDIIKDSDACSSSTTNGNITQGLERLLDIDLDLHRPGPSGQPPASVPPPHNFPNTVVSTHAPVPPMPQQFTQAYRPMQHHNYQFPGGPSNGAAEVLNKPPTTNAPMQPAPLLPPYNSDHNSCYMMGRPPPPFQ